MKYLARLQQTTEEFTRRNIPYALIRNYDFIDQKKAYEGKDIDIIVRKEDKKKITKLLLSQGYISLPLSAFTPHLAFAITCTEEKILSLHFHLNGVSGHHIPYYLGERILANKTEENKVSVSAPEDLLAILVLHSLLDKKRFEERYKKKILALLEQSNEEKLSIALTYALPRHAKRISKLIYTKEFTALEKKTAEYCQSFKQKKILSYLHYLLIRYGSYLWGVTRFFTPAPLVSIIGMDGTGKTTVTTRLESLFKKSLIKNTIIYGGRGKNNLLPLQFFGKRVKKRLDKKEAEKKQKTKKTSLKKKLLFSLSAPLFALDLFLRYWFIIHYKRMRNHLVITDRYSTDILLMKRVPRWEKRLLYCFFPRPTKVLYLHNDPETLATRKEHPLEDLKRQEKIFSRINQLIKPVCIKSEGKDKTFNAVAEEVIKTLKQ